MEAALSEEIAHGKVQAEEIELLQAELATENTNAHSAVMREQQAVAHLVKKQAEIKRLQADVGLLLTSLQWSNVNGGMAYILKGATYSRFLHGPLSQLREAAEAKGEE